MGSELIGWSTWRMTVVCVLLAIATVLGGVAWRNQCQSNREDERARELAATIRAAELARGIWCTRALTRTGCHTSCDSIYGWMPPSADRWDPGFDREVLRWLSIMPRGEVCATIEAAVHDPRWDDLCGPSKNPVD
jgi:hypothetical protein